MMNSALCKYMDFNSDLRTFTILALVSQKLSFNSFSNRSICFSNSNFRLSLRFLLKDEKRIHLPLIKHLVVSHNTWGSEAESLLICKNSVKELRNSAQMYSLVTRRY